MVKNKVLLAGILAFNIATAEPITAAQTQAARPASSSLKLGRTGVVAVYAALETELSPLLKATLERIKDEFQGQTIQDTLKKFAYYFANYKISTKKNAPQQGA